MRTLSGLLAISLLVFGIGGCGQPVTPTYPVSGKVTYNGKPVDGTINFEDRGGATPTSLDVVGGSYSGKTTEGDKRITIWAYKEINAKNAAKKIIGPGSDQAMKVNILPDKFNVNSKLSAKVAPGGAATFDFDLKDE